MSSFNPYWFLSTAFGIVVAIVNPKKYKAVYLSMAVVSTLIGVSGLAWDAYLKFHLVNIPTAVVSTTPQPETPQESPSTQGPQVQPKGNSEKKVETKKDSRRVEQKSEGSNSPNITQNGENNVVQLGNNNQATIIAGIPEGRCEVSALSNNVPAGEVFKSEIRLTVLPARLIVPNLYIEAQAATIVRAPDGLRSPIEIVPENGGGLVITGNSGIRNGYAFINMPNASGSYRLTVYSTKMETFTIGCQAN